MKYSVFDFFYSFLGLLFLAMRKKNILEYFPNLLNFFSGAHKNVRRPSIRTNVHNFLNKLTSIQQKKYNQQILKFSILIGFGDQSNGSLFRLDIWNTFQALHDVPSTLNDIKVYKCFMKSMTFSTFLFQKRLNDIFTVIRELSQHDRLHFLWTNMIMV